MKNFLQSSQQYQSLSLEDVFLMPIIADLMAVYLCCFTFALERTHHDWLLVARELSVLTLMLKLDGMELNFHSTIPYQKNRNPDDSGAFMYGGYGPST
ncbi:hypothetical protein T4D_9925 [Trichinella pseudospiralis]|uniref:Uncharacterized protein n=1 Tax=Trichinella pseudospiralis TaxID=6337 RepID=A0A0V1FZ04_TRIPS|nr:hypothetical protein T4D_9925 [Trichinella pseudospiralis]